MLLLLVTVLVFIPCRDKGLKINSKPVCYNSRGYRYVESLLPGPAPTCSLLGFGFIWIFIVCFHLPGKYDGFQSLHLCSVLHFNYVMFWSYGWFMLTVESLGRVQNHVPNKYWPESHLPEASSTSWWSRCIVVLRHSVGFSICQCCSFQHFFSVQNVYVFTYFRIKMCCAQNSVSCLFSPGVLLLTFSQRHSVAFSRVHILLMPMYDGSFNWFLIFTYLGSFSFPAIIS